MKIVIEILYSMEKDIMKNKLKVILSTVLGLFMCFSANLNSFASSEAGVDIVNVESLPYLISLGRGIYNGNFICVYDNVRYYVVFNNDRNSVRLKPQTFLAEVSIEQVPGVVGLFPVESTSVNFLNLRIPDMVNNIPVEEIRGNFSSGNPEHGITLPAFLRSLKHFKTNCIHIDFPETLEEINSCQFDGLKSFSVPHSNEEIVFEAMKKIMPEVEFWERTESGDKVIYSNFSL